MSAREGSGRLAGLRWETWEQEKGFGLRYGFLPLYSLLEAAQG